MTRIPAQPLYETAAYYIGKPLHTRQCKHCGNDPANNDACLRQQELANLLGISRKTVHRWSQYGVTLDQADKAATQLGYNPIAIWGIYWDEPDHV